jgi:hypothetical protein
VQTDRRIRQRILQRFDPVDHWFIARQLATSVEAMREEQRQVELGIRINRVRKDGGHYPGGWHGYAPIAKDP